MRDSALVALEVLVVPPDVSPTPETLILREHIRRILRKLPCPAASAQYS
ncbi:hypothetical protein SAMN02799625_01115 [Methylobacterium sp. UNC300MFChir4.1]|nr:hypothetical protein SAMN02799636_01743 [Methylobacterium sp. 275MFSha3.1]SEN28358.1 hypothetical protein SAMN02799625_01115 [Methylobacterium sp. UNC300MFChir4.1]